MSSVSMNIRMDGNIKKEAQALFSEFGLDMTTAINMFLRQSIREHRIPFELTLHVPNTQTLKAMDDVEKGIGISKTFESVDELMENLNA